MTTHKNVCPGAGSAVPAFRPPSLDLARIREWLGNSVEWPGGALPGDVQWNRVWVGRHARMDFELRIDLPERGGACTCFLQGSSVLEGRRRCAHAQARLHGGRLTGVRLYNDHLGIWCCTADRDASLRAARGMFHTQGSEHCLILTVAASLMRTNGRTPVLQSEVVAHRIAKRCTFRIRTADDEPRQCLYVKVFRRPPGREQLEAVRRLEGEIRGRSRDRVRIPSVLAFLPGQRALMLESVPQGGEPIADMDDGPASAAVALAALHGCETSVSPIHTPQHEFQTVCRWVPALRVMGIEMHAHLRDLVLVLAPRLRAVAGPPTALLHRDFHSRQMLRAEGALWLVDFDTLCRGHAELDLATFAAHLFLEGILAGDRSATVEGRLDRFVDRYRALGGCISVVRLPFYVSCALARLGALCAARGVPMDVIDAMWSLSEGYASGAKRFD